MPYSPDQIYAAIRAADQAGDGNAVRVLSAQLQQGQPAQPSAGDYISTLHAMIADPSVTRDQIHQFAQQSGHPFDSQDEKRILDWRDHHKDEASAVQLRSGAGGKVEGEVPDSTVWGAMRSAAEGMTAHLFDPVAAAGNALIPGLASLDNAGGAGLSQESIYGGHSFGDAYAHNLNAARGETAANQAVRPALSTGSELAGAVFSPINKVGGVIKGVGWGAQLGRAALSGGAYGATYAGSQSNAQTLQQGAEDVAGGAGAGIVGGLIGHAAGSIVGGIADGASTAIGNAARRLMGIESNSVPAGVGLVSQRLAQDGLDPTMAAHAIQTGADNGTPVMLADLGDNTRALAGSVSRQPGVARQIAAQATLERQAGQGERIRDAINSDLGPTTDTFQESNNLIQQAKARAAPLYEQAYAAPAQTSDKLQAILDTPAAKSAITKARAIAGNEMQNPEALGLGEEGTLTKMPSWQTLDYVKRGLDDILEQNRNPVTGKLALDESGRAINGVKSQLLAEMDKLNPAYKDARLAYAGPAQLNSAMLAGRSAVTKSASEINQRLNNMSPTERNQYALGLRSALADVIDKMPDGANKAAKLVNSPAKRAALARALGDTADLDKFLERMNLEQSAYETYATVNRGSPTASRVAEDQANSGIGLAQTALGGARAARHGLTGLAGWGAEHAINAARFGVGKAGERAREDAASLLFTSNPSDFTQALEKAKATRDVTLAKRNAFSIAGGRIGANLSSQANNAFMAR